MKERYNKLAQEYNLPDFNYMDHEFEIHFLEEERFLLRAIKDKIVDKLDDYVKILEDILNPDSNSYSSMYETRVLTDEDKMMVLAIHKKFMILIRKALYISVDNKDEDIAPFIIEIYHEWDGFKPNLKKIAKDLCKAWEEERFDEDKKVRYMG